MKVILETEEFAKILKFFDRLNALAHQDRSLEEYSIFFKENYDTIHYINYHILSARLNNTHRKKIDKLDYYTSGNDIKLEDWIKILEQ